MAQFSTGGVAQFSTGDDNESRMLLDISGRRRLGKASKKGSWYKTVSWMEEVGSHIVGPDLARADTLFQDTVARLFAWIG